MRVNGLWLKKLFLRWTYPFRPYCPGFIQGDALTLIDLFHSFIIGLYYVIYLHLIFKYWFHAGVFFGGGVQWLYPSPENWIVSNRGCRMIFLEAHSVIASSSRSFNMINTSSSYSLWGKTLGRSISSCLSQQMAPATQLTEARKPG